MDSAFGVPPSSPICRHRSPPHGRSSIRSSRVSGRPPSARGSADAPSKIQRGSARHAGRARVALDALRNQQTITSSVPRCKNERAEQQRTSPAGSVAHAVSVGST